MAIPSKIFDSPKGRGVNDKRTICEVHRCLYDKIIINILPEDPKLADELVSLLEEAFTMGVKMNNKLIERKFNTRHEHGFLQDNNSNVAVDRKTRQKIVKKLWKK